VERQLDCLDDYLAKDLIQHDPEIADGSEALRRALEAEQKGEPRLCYHKLHRVLAEGNFVLCMIEGNRDGLHSGLYNLFRVAEGKIVEQWTTVSPIAPRSEWKNDNGKF
jgi:predicted SnoaL-like aldol condensation-catalyzing enzyme